MTVASLPESPSACGGFDSQSQHSYSRALPVLRSPSWRKESYYTETGKRRAILKKQQVCSYILVSKGKQRNACRMLCNIVNVHKWGK